MRIVQSDTKRLVLQDERALAAAVIGVLVLLLGSGALYFLARSVELHCERLAPQDAACVVTEQLLGLVPIEQRRFAHVDGVYVKRRQDEDGTKYDAVLLTEAGTIRLTPMSLGDDEDLLRTVEPLRVLLRGDGATTLDLALPVTWMSISIGGILLGFSFCLLLLSRPARAELDRRVGTLRLRRRSAIGTGDVTLSLEDIAEVFVDAKSDADGGGYAVAVRTPHNRVEVLSRGHNEARESAEEAVHAVRAFLGIAPPEPGNGS